jgi:hypothetical protein
MIQTRVLAAALVLALVACGGVPRKKTPLTILTVTLHAGTEGQPYSETLTASGGVAPYTWKVAGGTLPSGLQLNSETGEISGTVRPGIEIREWTFTVAVFDSSR